jgi:hypothetical protein
MTGIRILCLLLALSVVACGPRPLKLKPGERFDYAEVTFSLPDYEVENQAFRWDLWQLTRHRQIRNGPVEADHDLTTSNSYILDIMGECQGAVQDIEPFIRTAAARFPDSSSLVAHYRETATCEPRVGTAPAGRASKS